MVRGRIACHRVGRRSRALFLGGLRRLGLRRLGLRRLGLRRLGLRRPGLMRPGLRRRSLAWSLEQGHDRQPLSHRGCPDRCPASQTASGWG
jgi:hypothetical protein